MPSPLIPPLPQFREARTADKPRAASTPQRGTATALSERARALAMEPGTVQRLCAESLQRARPQLATILQFRAEVTPEQRGPVLSPAGALALAAREYLRHPAPPNGYAKQLAERYGVNYGSLLQRIYTDRQRGTA